jgi:hypothetical protein
VDHVHQDQQLVELVHVRRAEIEMPGLRDRVDVDLNLDGALRVYGAAILQRNKASRLTGSFNPDRSKFCTTGPGDECDRDVFPSIAVLRFRKA